MVDEEEKVEFLCIKINISDETIQLELEPLVLQSDLLQLFSDALTKDDPDVVNSARVLLCAHIQMLVVLLLQGE